MTLHETIVAAVPLSYVGGVAFRPMRAADLPRLILQPSQVSQFGLHGRARDEAHGAELVASGAAWTAEAEDGRILCIAGFAEVFAGRQAIAWALLSQGIGAAHFRLARFIRARIAEQPHRRIEAVARADHAAELKWLALLGFERIATMRAWGPTSEDHVLFELVRDEEGR